MATKNLDALFTCKDLTWATPQHVFVALDAEFGFDLDVCASEENAKCNSYFCEPAACDLCHGTGKVDGLDCLSCDGLKQAWHSFSVSRPGPVTCWMNPPYGSAIKHWIQKAYEEAQQGATVVCLIPARTDTAYWHNYVMKASEIRLVRGRLKFGNAKDSAPFPSAIVIFRFGELDGTPRIVSCGF